MGQSLAPIVAHHAGAMARRLAMLAALAHLAGSAPQQSLSSLLLVGAGLVGGRFTAMAWRIANPGAFLIPGLLALVLALTASWPIDASPPWLQGRFLLLAFGCEMANALIDPRRRGMMHAAGLPFGPVAAKLFLVELVLGISLVLTGLEAGMESALGGWQVAAIVLVSFVADGIGCLWPGPISLIHSEAVPWPDADEKRSVVWAALASGIAVAAKLVLTHQGMQFHPDWADLWPVVAGIVAGAILPAVFCSPPRQEGWFPIAGITGLAGFAILGIVGHLCWGSRLVFSMAVGMAIAAARSTAMPRGKVHPLPRLLRLGGPFVIAIAITIMMDAVPTTVAPIAAVILLAVLTAASAWYLKRSFIELVIEIGLTPVYRIEAVGPGLSGLPEGEPVLLIANHTAYADPFWLGSIVRRRFYPMMTSTFYDLPVISFLMRDVVGAIRVPAVSHRKDAPELREAARLLEDSRCVLVFPEGTLRKVPEPVMRRFGRGVVKLLAEHPHTWVVPAWIEGAWGSYFSEAGGRPMTGKSMDFWRSIRIGIGEPRRMDPELLANHLKARVALQQAVYDCRGILGLDVPTAPPVFENQADDPA